MMKMKSHFITPLPPYHTSQISTLSDTPFNIQRVPACHHQHHRHRNWHNSIAAFALLQLLILELEIRSRCCWWGSGGNATGLLLPPHITPCKNLYPDSKINVEHSKKQEAAVFHLWFQFVNENLLLLRKSWGWRKFYLWFVRHVLSSLASLIHPKQIDMRNLPYSAAAPRDRPKIELLRRCCWRGSGGCCRAAFATTNRTMLKSSSGFKNKCGTFQKARNRRIPFVVLICN